MWAQAASRYNSHYTANYLQAISPVKLDLPCPPPGGSARNGSPVCGLQHFLSPAILLNVLIVEENEMRPCLSTFKGLAAAHLFPGFPPYKTCFEIARIGLT